MLVLAGAGSGKTSVITNKIAWLLTEGRLRGNTLYAVTFTNKAAQEMKHRVRSLLPANLARGLSISTFHTLGLRMLQSDADAMGYRRGITIMDDTDSHAAIREIIRELDSAQDSDSVKPRIAAWKNDFTWPQQAIAGATNDNDLEIARIYARYTELLQACNAVDFDDLIAVPVRALQENHELREKWQNRVRHLLVDEYQDTNAAQYELIKLIVGKFGGLTAVGDDDQSIYSWRGARPENLALLKTDFPGLKVIKLEQNYRSTRRILRSANQLIANNPHLFEKKLWSDLGEGEPLRVMACRNADDEASWLAAEILTLKFRKKIRFSDIAILYRSNFQSRPFEKALREKQVPYKLSGGSSFFDRAEIKDVLAYLRLLVNPLDDSAFLRIVNTPRREIGASTLEKLGRHARQRNNSLLASCRDLGLAESLGERALKRLNHFAGWISTLAEHAKSGDPLEVVQQVLRESDYQDWLKETASSPVQADARWRNVQELLNWIEQLANDGSGKRENLQDIVAHISLMDMISQNDDKDDNDQVSMMTLHAAKGLEFPYTYIVGMEEEILPHRSSLEDDFIEEERRLAYVGITRARQSLTFTWARQRQRYGERVDCEPSRFLYEIPEDDLLWIGDETSNTSPEQLRQTGQDTLAGLKSLLSE
ncbi:MAG: UvrD-helicase domain-containing protein [Gammaproteobacteria bacterium]|nr:UvrD-helicase domain-containing protein [Gammaproteobacteria bacterium]